MLLLPISTRSTHRVKTVISNGAVQVWLTDLHVRRGISMGARQPVPPTCDSVEALLRRELLAHIPEWLARKAGVLGCTSSHTILFMCWKENFSNEDATRFGLGQ